MIHIGTAVCVNEEGKLLMVLQGKPEEEKRWSVPGGKCEIGETLPVCCAREVWEETGYKVEVMGHLRTKPGFYKEPYEVHYFDVKVLEGIACIQDPDGLIYAIAWKSVDELQALPLCFEEDRHFLLQHIMKVTEEEVT
ncbi:NUDIX hydrolase [Ectobacillus sp. JY-23]|uniref:NUDIX hydrolase n=1 Tax=Ectobacillus sp. JY-23 TaxID=2933872 RepID=UPI001FF64A46|nr:NUDIX hydrolase [Ectobacillus sp. JY-23]UOY92206.1 NUDIX hydrolase [Ectobacillus sp. JY-23]